MAKAVVLQHAELGLRRLVTGASAQMAQHKHMRCGHYAAIAVVVRMTGSMRHIVLPAHTGGEILEVVVHRGADEAEIVAEAKRSRSLAESWCQVFEMADCIVVPYVVRRASLAFRPKFPRSAT